MTGTDIAELALQALVDCQRDADWMVGATLNEAMGRVLQDGGEGSLQLANNAILMHHAITRRLAILQPLIATAIAEREKADRDAGLSVPH